MSADRILIVSSHGLGIRDIFLNETLSARLLQRFEIDLMSPFTSIRTDEWGIRKHYEIGQASGLGRFFKTLNHRAASTRLRMAFRRFHLETGWESLYEALRYYSDRPGIGINYERWARLDRGPLGALLSRATRLFPIRYPLSTEITKANYTAVVVTHPLDGECVIAAQIARRAGVPVICVVVGIDHLFTGGPVMMTPDLLLVWGAEQAEHWRDHHAVFRPQLANTRVVQVGGLSHDRMASETDRGLFADEYPLIDAEARVVTFAAFTERAYPNQPGTCDAILQTFSKLGVKGHLVVRVRPGNDEGIWREYALSRPDLVTIQIPRGVFFTKWNTESSINRATEEHEVKLFGATLRRSDVVVTAGFSTVYIDAFAAGTPAIATAITPDSAASESLLERTYRLYKLDVKSIVLVDIATSYEQLMEKVIRVLTSDEQSILNDEVKSVYELVAGSPDKLAGERAANAIFSFLNSTDLA
ncbi:hypothetical protein FIL92_00955 [SAR202 cluster bacterium AD-812-D07_MRT_10900m]|nr:hypothetical protein [SAR202 cluster bacterium AD-812-D07_MRT_10900m]